MNFIPQNDYDGLLAQAKAMHRIIEAMEKSKSIQGKAVDDLTRQLLICGKDHLESEREANQMLTDQVLRLEQERDQLKAENIALKRAAAYVIPYLSSGSRLREKLENAVDSTAEQCLAKHDDELTRQTFRDTYKAGFDHGLQCDKNAIEKLNGTSSSIRIFDHQLEHYINDVAERYLRYLRQEAQENNDA